MSVKRIVFLSENLPWLLIKDDVIVSRGEHFARADAAEDDLLVVIPRADDVALQWADLPGLAPAQALGAARLIAAEQSLIATDQLFVVCGDEQGDDGARVIATANRIDVARWVELYDPDFIIPSPLLISPPEAGFARADLGHETVLCAARMGFAEDGVVSPLIMADASVTTLDRDEIEATLLAAIQSPPLNLRSGEFMRKRVWTIDRDWLRWVGIVTAALIIVSLLVPLVQIIRLNWEAALLEETSASLAQAALGEAVPAENAVTELDTRLAALRSGGAGFVATQSAVTRTIATTGNTELTAMQFTPDGLLKITVRAASVAELDVVQGKLRALGLVVTPGPVNPSQGQPLIDLQVRGR